MKVGEKKEKKRESNRAREKCRGPNMCVIGIYFDVKHDLLALLMSSSASSFAWCIVYPISTVRVARLLPWRMTKQLIDLLHVWRCWCILTATTAIIKNKHTCSLFDAIRCGWCCCRTILWLALGCGKGKRVKFMFFFLRLNLIAHLAR